MRSGAITSPNIFYSKHALAFNLMRNVLSGVSINNATLMIRVVGRRHSGHFKCIAANSEGRNESNQISLTVQCKSKLFSSLSAESKSKSFVASDSSGSFKPKCPRRPPLLSCSNFRWFCAFIWNFMDNFGASLAELQPSSAMNSWPLLG